MDTQEYLDGLSNDQLLAAAREANEDCIKAANIEKDSEWHQACFAAMFVYSQEMSKRGIKLVTVH